MRTRGGVFAFMLAISACGGGSSDPPAPETSRSIFEKQALPVWTGFPDTGAAADPSIVDDGGLFRMYYTALIPGDVPDEERVVIGVAESSNGTDWRYANLPPVDNENPTTIALDAPASSWDKVLETPEVIKNGNQYFMYYAGYTPANDDSLVQPADIALAQSSDGLQFSRISDTAILQRTPSGFDSAALFSPTVIAWSGRFYMVYTGWCLEGNCPAGSDPGFRLLGASSDDGITWTKETTPVLDGATLDLPWAMSVNESSLVAGPDGLFYLFFSAAGTTAADDNVIGVARSGTPFGPWDVNPEPIIQPTAPWEFSETIAPDVLINDTAVRVWYMGNDESFTTFSIGYADSAWPLKW